MENRELDNVLDRPQPVGEKDPNRFDTQTHYWDRQGRLMKTNHYNCWNVNGIKYYERPVNSGNLFYDNNQPAGRFEGEFTAEGSNKGLPVIYPDREHKAYVEPLKGAAKLIAEMDDMKLRNAELERELAAIKADREVAAESLAQLASAEVPVEAPKKVQTTPTLSRTHQPPSAG